MKSFADAALPPALLKALDSLGYQRPTEVQAQSLPPMLAGRDVRVQASTGSGKTAAFGLALLSALRTDTAELQALVLCPTRELADQVARELRGLARFIPNVKILSLCGGVSVRPQLASLQAHEPHIVVGTPGRIEDLIKRQALPLDRIHRVILDEADRMLDMGFIEPIGRILGQLPRERSTGLFSATYAEEIRQISREFQHEPIEVEIAGQAADVSIAQHFYKVEKQDKPAALQTLLGERAPSSCLVFCNTRIDTRDVAARLQAAGFSALALHGELDQRERDEIVVQFGNGSCQVLVATDVASRGLHIEGLPMVIAYELPTDPAVHVHRIGRTGRAGESGLACALVSGREQGRIQGIEALTGMKLSWSALPTRSGKPQRPAMKTLIIDAGRKDRLRPGDILGALTGAGGLRGDEVGKIDVFATRAYVAVSRERAPSVVRALRQAQIKGRKFRIRDI